MTDVIINIIPNQKIMLIIRAVMFTIQRLQDCNVQFELFRDQPSFSFRNFCNHPFFEIM